MDEAPVAAIDAGWQALEAGDWPTARDAFAAVLDSGSPEAMDGYGLALWLLGDTEAGIDYRQRACLRYGERGDCDRAAQAAAWVSHQYLIAGRTSLSNGWLARAERALEGHEDCSGAGWVAVERARRTTGKECLQGAARAFEIGRSCGDGDLEVFALSLLGAAEIEVGRFEEGMLRLEEAMAAATAGRIRNPHTLGSAYCYMIVACTTAGDWDRAAEWCEHVDGYATRTAIMPLHGACRVVHAEVLVAAGRWRDAEAALSEALRGAGRNTNTSGTTAATLAHLRVLQGRLAEAARLLADRDERPAALLALAELRMAEGEPRVAAGLLERGLANAGTEPVVAGRLRAPLVDAYIACDRIADAAAAAEALRDFATATGGQMVTGWAELASSSVALASGDAAGAHEHARRALDAFSRLAMPYDAARARLALARAAAGEQPELAVEEARTALAVFRDLGATRDQDAAAAVLRELGAGSGPGSRAEAELTNRERQVLDLIAQGMSNAQIGSALYISEKTAGHHVSRILAKLGVSNRAEAATHASRVGSPAGE
jgi:ATP/maltotriose-dependent transcriptional regulator MalT